MTVQELAATKDLLPCPFCGGRADFGKYNEVGLFSPVVFCSMFACGVEIKGDTLIAAAEKWNKRPPIAFTYNGGDVVTIS